MTKIRTHAEKVCPMSNDELFYQMGVPNPSAILGH